MTLGLRLGLMKRNSRAAVSAYDAGYEYQAITFSATPVYGKFIVDSTSVDFTSGVLSASAMQSVLEGKWGTGNVEVSDITNGYQLKFVGSLAQDNLAQPTVTASTSFPLNDGTGTAPTKGSQSTYVAGSTAQPEIFKIEAGPNPSGQATLSGGGTIDYDGDGNITAMNVPGYICTGGGLGVGYADFQYGSSGDQTNESVVSGGGSVSVTLDGTPDIPAVSEVWTVNVGFADGNILTGAGASIDSVGGTITAVTPPSGVSINNGGVGWSFVEFNAPPGDYSDDYISSDGTSGAYINISTQGSGSVAGQAETFTYYGPGPSAAINAISNSGFTDLSMTSQDGVITALDSLPGFTIQSGGIGYSEVTYEASSNGPVADYYKLSGTCTVSVLQQGSSDVTEVLATCVINFTGAAGYVTFADGFSAVAFSVTDTGTNIKNLLNGASAYNASKVSSVTVTSTSITITYAATYQPTGTITVGGKTGAAVTVSNETLQDGVN